MKARRPARSGRPKPRAPADVSPRNQRRRSGLRGSRPRTSGRAPGRAGPRPAVSFGRALGAASGTGARAGLRVLVLCALLAAGALLLTSPAFAARQVDVSGNRHLTRAEVLRRTGLAGTRSVFLVTPEVAQAALRADPYVRSASIRTLLPGEVYISVVEWEPYALLHRDGRDYLLNSDGTVLGPGTALAAGSAPGQPHLELSWAAAGVLRPGERAISGRLLQDLRRIRDAFPGVYHLNVQAISIAAGQQLVVETREGPRILFGQMITGEQLDSLDAKLASLKGLSAQLDLASARLEYINLMNPAQPVTKAIPSPSPSPSPSAHPSPPRR